MWRLLLTVSCENKGYIYQSGQPIDISWTLVSAFFGPISKNPTAEVDCYWAGIHPPGRTKLPAKHMDEFAS